MWPPFQGVLMPSLSSLSWPRWLAISLLVAVFVARPSLGLANGRPPAGLDIRVRGAHILVSTTFGTVQSKDNGATWTWMCEAAFGTGGVFDPDFELSTKSDAIFTTAIEGMQETRDGCSYTFGVLGERFIAALASSPNGDIYAAASDDAGSKIYRSTDDGLSYPQSSNAFRNYDTWRSIEVAPSDPNRLYITGLRVVFGMPKQYLVYRSTDAGKTFTAGGLTGITKLTENSVLFLAGVSSTNPNVVYARVTAAGTETTEAIYRSTDGGDTWTELLTRPEPIAFLVRRNGELIAGTDNSGTAKSTDGGTTFIPLADAPHVLCLAEDAGGKVYACTQNYGGDGAAVMSSTDGGLTWTKTVRFQDISGPNECAVGTMQRDYCVPVEWCGLTDQLGIIAKPIACGDGGSDAGGCCDAQNSTGESVFLVLFFGLLVLRLRGEGHRSASRRS